MDATAHHRHDISGELWAKIVKGIGLGASPRILSTRPQAFFWAKSLSPFSQDSKVSLSAALRLRRAR